MSDINQTFNQIVLAATDIGNKYNVRVTVNEKFEDRIRIYFHFGDICSMEQDDLEKFGDELKDLVNVIGLTYANWFDGSMEYIL